MSRTRRRMMLITLALLCIPSVVVYALISQRTFSTHAVANGDWTMFQGDLGHSGFNKTETLLNTQTAPQLKLQWTHHAGGSISSQVVEANGLLYWGSWDGLEHASNPANGTDVWTSNVGTTTPTN